MQPFEVMCINSVWIVKGWVRFKAWLFGWSKSHPVFGEVYTVVEVKEDSGKIYYVLAECNEVYGYNSKCFILLSDIDEKEFVREPLKETK